VLVSAAEKCCGGGRSVGAPTASTGFDWRRAGVTNPQGPSRVRHTASPSPSKGSPAVSLGEPFRGPFGHRRRQLDGRPNCEPFREAPGLRGHRRQRGPLHGAPRRVRGRIELAQSPGRAGARSPGDIPACSSQCSGIRTLLADRACYVAPITGAGVPRAYAAADTELQWKPSCGRGISMTCVDAAAN